MKPVKRTFAVICASLLVVVWGSASQAFQRGHHRARYGSGHAHYSIHGRYGHASRHYSKHGRSRTHRLGHKDRHYGRKYRYKHGGRHLGYRHYGLGFHLGHGYYKYRHYRYRYPHSYHYKPYTHKSYKTYGYPKSYSLGEGYDEYDGAWNLLRKGRPAEAADAFGRLAKANPNEGMPKIGYALAAAELGRLDKGVWAMRRALRMDPESLHYVTVGKLMQPKVESVIQRYEQSHEYGSNSDGPFMVAALHYLLGDVDAAQKVMERDSNGYETSTSAENLRVLIEEETVMQDN